MHVSGYYKVTLVLSATPEGVKLGSLNVTDALEKGLVDQLIADSDVEGGEIEDRIEVLVEASADYRRGTKPYFSCAHGNWLPGDPAEITNFKCKIGDHDITKLIPDAVTEILSEKLLQEGA